MEKDDLQKCREKLEAMRAEILKVINSQLGTSADSESRDEIDHANELIQREMGHLVFSNIKSNLLEINDALERIEKKRYGKCLLCRCEIPAKRLEARPFAKYCVPCQEKTESKNR